MVFEKICKIIAEQLNIDEDSIDINTDLVEDLGADSLDKVELVMAIEDEFGITIPDEDTNNAMVTVGEIAEYVENLL